MRGPPQYGFAVAICLIRALTSELTFGRPEAFPPRNPRPIDSEVLPLPTDDGVRVDQVQGTSPRGPDSRKHHPEQSIFPPQSRNSLPPLQHCQLLAKGKVLKRQIAALSDSCPNQNSKPSHYLDHGSQSGGTGPINQ